MAKVIRTLTYEFDNEADLQRVIKMSLPDGETSFGSGRLIIMTTVESDIETSPGADRQNPHDQRTQ